MSDDLRSKLGISQKHLDNVNTLLLDPNSQVVNAFLDVIAKHGTVQEINRKAREARHLPRLMTRLKEIDSPYLQDLEWLIAQRDQGAFISVSHPFDVLRKGHWQVDELTEILPLIDAIETFNARCMRPQFNQQAHDFASQHDIPGTAGSDAHSLREIGKATFTVPDFSTAGELRSVIRQAEFQASMSSPLIHFTSRWAVWRKQMNPKLIKQG